MKLSKVLLFFIGILGVFIGTNDAAPKIPIKAIKKGGEIIGKGLRAINIGNTIHDIYGHFHKKKKKH